MSPPRVNQLMMSGSTELAKQPASSSSRSSNTSMARCQLTGLDEPQRRHPATAYSILEQSVGGRPVLSANIEVLRALRGLVRTH